MQLTIREPGSAITHFIACLMALMAASPLMIKAQGNTTNMLAMAVFAGSMILLYGASTAYHSISRVSDKVLRIFRKIDHMMIFVLIAGSYPCMSYRTRRKNGLFPAGSGLGNRSGRHDRKGMLDYLSQVVLFCYLYRNGLDLSSGIRHSVGYPAPRSIRLVIGRRHHLYNRRHYLCTETTRL